MVVEKFANPGLRVDQRRGGALLAFTEFLVALVTLKGRVFFEGTLVSMGTQGKPPSLRSLLPRQTLLGFDHFGRKQKAHLVLANLLDRN